MDRGAWWATVHKVTKNRTQLKGQYEHTHTLSTQNVERITTALNSAVLSGSVMSNSETLWTVACQAPLSMEFSRQEYWSGLPCPPPGDLPDPGIEPVFPSLAGSERLY